MIVTSRLRCSGVRQSGSLSLPRRQRRVLCRAEKETTKPKPEEAKATETDRSGDSAFSEEELARLAALKAQKSSGDPEGGMIQGALSEVNLIDWPAPGKAALETVYVLLIVVGATAFLFGLNGVFTEIANKLY